MSYEPKNEHRFSGNFDIQKVMIVKRQDLPPLFRYLRAKIMKSLLLLLERMLDDSVKVTQHLYSSVISTYSKQNIELERATKTGAFFFPTENVYMERFRNLASPNTQRKNIVYLTFLVAFSFASLLSMQDKPNEIAVGIALSVIAACIFDVIINIIPLELERYERAMKIQKVVGDLVELKYANYINFGFREDPLATGFFVRSPPLDRETALDLIELIESNSHSKPTIAQIPPYYWAQNKMYVFEGNEQFLAYSYYFFEKGLIHISRLAENGAFPDLEKAILQMLEVISENRIYHTKSKLYTRYAINHYFAFTDVLVHRTNMNCLAYCRSQFGCRRDILEPTEAFMREAKHIGNISWH